MRKFILTLCLIPSIAFATKLEDVKILSVAPGNDKLELKLRSKEGPKGSYFYVDITKRDANSFEKLVHVINKLMRRDKFELDMDIQSFSPSPGGSYYKSEGITFYGTAKP
jgi:hypothetical protein